MKKTPLENNQTNSELENNTSASDATEAHPCPKDNSPINYVNMSVTMDNTSPTNNEGKPAEVGDTDTIADSNNSNDLNTGTSSDVAHNATDNPNESTGPHTASDICNIEAVVTTAKASNEETAKAFDLIRQQMEKLDGVSMKEKR